jgi:hypothetical protein
MKNRSCRPASLAVDHFNRFTRMISMTNFIPPELDLQGESQVKSGTFHPLWTPKSYTMERQNLYVQRYRQESTILGRGSSGPFQEGLPRGDIDTLRGLLLQRKGSENHPGKYYYSQGNQWLPSAMEILKEKEDLLREQWKRYVQSRINIGEQPPSQMPRHLQEPRERLEAQRIVLEEEIEVLQDLLARAEEAKQTRDKKQVPPQYWGAGRLHDGILVEFCGWDVSKNSAGILAVDDPSSPFNGMEIWRLKAQVVNPLHAEFRLRQREEATAVEAENRPRRNVPFPPVPQYDPKTDQIQYPGSWSNQTIRKIKYGEEVNTQGE